MAVGIAAAWASLKLGSQTDRRNPATVRESKNRKQDSVFANNTSDNSTPPKEKSQWKTTKETL
jgi:hypothetical protein